MDDVGGVTIRRDWNTVIIYPGFLYYNMLCHCRIPTKGLEEEEHQWPGALLLIGGINNEPAELLHPIWVFGNP